MPPAVLVGVALALGVALAGAFWLPALDWQRDTRLGLAGEGTVSLGFCPDRAVPWPARGVHRWDEATLLRVNRTFLKVDEAVACLDFIWDQAPVIKRLVNRCLVRILLHARLYERTNGALEAAYDAIRPRCLCLD